MKINIYCHKGVDLCSHSLLDGTKGTKVSPSDKEINPNDSAGINKHIEYLSRRHKKLHVTNQTSSSRKNAHSKAHKRNWRSIFQQTNRG